MLIVTDKESASNVQRGDQYAIDVWPDPPISDEEIDTLDARFAEAQKLHDSLQTIIDKSLLLTRYTKTQLRKIVEVDLVKIAKQMGIDASEDDLKEETVLKILDYQNRQ